MGQRIEFRLRLTELAEKLEDGWSTGYILRTYMPKWGMAKRSLERYIALAKDIVSARMQKRENVVEAVRADIIAHEAEKWLKSTLELEARLCAIVSGKVAFNKPMKNGQDIQKVETNPSCGEVIRAIDILLKLRGVYKAADGTRDEAAIFKIIVKNEEEKRLVEMNRDNP